MSPPCGSHGQQEAVAEQGGRSDAWLRLALYKDPWCSSQQHLLWNQLGAFILEPVRFILKGKRPSVYSRRKAGERRRLIGMLSVPPTPIQLFLVDTSVLGPEANGRPSESPLFNVDTVENISHGQQHGFYFVAQRMVLGLVVLRWAQVQCSSLPKALFICQRERARAHKQGE